MKLQKQIQKPEDTTCHLVTKIGDQPSKLAQILKDHGCKVKELQTGEISYRYDRISKEELAKVTYLILQADMEFMVYETDEIFESGSSRSLR